jgi:hypothetical protein
MNNAKNATARVAFLFLQRSTEAFAKLAEKT